MTILVTGATGFLGRHVLPLLLKRKARALVLPEDPDAEQLKTSHVNIAYGDVTDPATLPDALAGVKQVIHLAGFVNGGQGAPEEFMRANAQGTANLAQAARAAHVEHFVYSSSITVYGLVANAHEDAQLEPTPGYPLSKIEAEKVIRETLGEQATILRFPLVLGVGDKGFMQPAVLGFQKAGRVTIVGSGREPWSVICANDAARALVMALDKTETRGQTYNVTGALITNGELLSAMGEDAGCKAITRIPKMLAMGVAWFSELFNQHILTRDQVLALSNPLSADSSRFEALGFAPESNWRTVLAESVEWALQEAP